MIVQRFNLNLIPNQSPVVVHVNQYDTGTGRLIATLYEGNEPYSPNGTAVIQGTKPDGHGFQYTATLDGNVVTADLTEQMSPVAGDVRAQIVVTESSGVTGTFVFIMRVQPSALPSDTDMSESDYPLIEEAIREAQEAVETAQEATETAQEAAQRAQEAIAETSENAENSEAWAQGTRGGIPVEPTDPTYEHNAEYWAQYAERYAQGGLHYKASIPFADIPTTGMREGDMYDITDDFTTDSRFTEGAGIKVKGGTNIAWNSDNKWDILALPYIPKTTFNGRSGSILPIAGDYDSKKILLSSALHIGGETQNDVQEALEALSNDGVKSFNGRSGSVLPMAGDYSAEQVNYDSNKTVKQVIDALVTKEASDIAGQQSLLKDTVGWTGKNKLPLTLSNLKSINTSGTWNGNSYTHNNVTYTITAENDIVTNIALSGTASTSGGSNLFLWANGIPSWMDADKDYILSGCASDGSASTYSIQYNNWTEGAAYQKIDNGNGVTIRKITDSTTQKIRIWIRQNVDASGLNFKPMVRDASITDPTYEPYHESVEQILHNAEVIDGKNLIDLNKTNSMNSNVQVTLINHGLKVETIASATYGASKTLLDGLIVGERYVVSFTVISSDNANCKATIRDTSNNIKAVSRYGTSTGSFNFEFEYAAGDYLSILVTDSPASSGSTTLDNIMLCTKEEWDKSQDFEPYYIPLKESKVDWTSQGVLGAKNLLPNNATSQTVNGVTFTVNDDGSITANGTASAIAFLPIVPNNTMTIKKGSYILSAGDGIIGNYSKYGIYINNASRDIANTKTEEGAHFALSADILVAECRIFVTSGTTVSNLTFYPMIRLASDPDDTYQPYAMTNRELTENFAGLKYKLLTVDEPTAVNTTKDTNLSTLVSGNTFFIISALFKHASNNGYYSLKPSEGTVTIAFNKTLRVNVADSNFIGGDMKVLVAYS